jgi:hypothetical protein
LSQKFYELIFAQCRQAPEYDILSQIAVLKYKSPVYIALVNDMPRLAGELVSLLTANPNNPEIEEFRIVCGQAADEGVALTISGDMYPELK